MIKKKNNQLNNISNNFNSTIGHLTASWSIISLGDISNVVSGSGFPKSLQGRRKGELPFFKVGDISAAWLTGLKKIYIANNYISEKEAAQIKAKVLPKGTVVFAKIGEALKLNRRAILGQSSLVDNNVMGLVHDNNVIDSNYLFYFMLTVDLGKFSRATAVPSIRKSDVIEIQIPLSPYSEQKRIVAEIEKQFSRLNEAVDNLKRVKANLKRFKASVLKAAVEGKLTEEWRKKHPDVEPADKLLERILAERRKKWEEAELAKMNAKGKEPKDDKWKKKYREPAKPNLDDLPSLPGGWLWVSLETTSEALGGYAFKSKKYSESGYQIVKMANIKMNTLDLSQRPSFITDIPDHIFDKYSLIDCDILITLTGTRKKRDYGYIVEIKNHEKSLLLNQRIARLRPYIQGISSYISIAIQSEDFRDRFFSYETGNVGQGNVGMRAVTIEVIALPPLAEQEKIIVALKRSFSMADRIYTQVDRNLKRADRLRQSILKKAFSGKLIQNKEL